MVEDENEHDEISNENKLPGKKLERGDQGRFDSFPVMFLLPFLVYTYLTNSNMSMPDTSYVMSWMNTTANSFFINTSLPSFSMNDIKWTTLPPSPMDPRIDMTPFATFYFLSGAVFFLGSAWMLLPRNDRAIDGIATMSDFTKTSLRRHYEDDSKGFYNRELRSILRSNGMEIDELIYRMSGTVKRSRRPVST
jgi:hypothetical protein